MKLFSQYIAEAKASDYIRVDNTGDAYEYADGFGNYVKDFGSLDVYQQQIIIKNVGDLAISSILQSKPKLTAKIKVYILEYVFSRMGSHIIKTMIPKLKEVGIVTEPLVTKYCTKLMSKHNSIFDNWNVFMVLVDLRDDIGLSSELVEKILHFNPIFLIWSHFTTEEDRIKFASKLTVKQVSAALSCEEVIVRFHDEYNKLMHLLLKDNSVLINKWKRYAENVRSMA
jgi:hypothetical protein